MKTSNKLLLSFVGLIVLLMLLADTVMWANYKRGKSGDGDLGADEHFTRTKTIPINAFKVLKIEGDGQRKQDVIRREKYEISFLGDSTQFVYAVQNDTMFIKLRGEGQFVLGCPEVKTVILSGGSGVSLQNFDVHEMNISADNSSYIELISLKANVLNVKGGEETEYFAMGEYSQIDSIHLQLGKSSSLKSFDVPYGHVSMDVDNLQELELRGKSLSSMKQIK
ncbi:hypothetical protein [Chitinophaga sp. S165]|uniref:hypothetical protein n=1 Tax=Chitinophaga sp. S165 TaxID=2135462 RepID=UPI000D715B7D|nr:hypothetical protein [Chitinophaga sp. S165]PWV48148.1 hypothetical protein C7475_10754 [Chitinophaga sp. S165]